MKKQRQRIWIVHFISMLAILGSFAIGSLVLANVGIRVYKNIVVNNAKNFQLRTSLSFIATKVRQYEEIGKISVLEKEGTSMLVLQEAGEPAYHTMIYYHDGQLKELLQEEGLEYKLQDGFCVTELAGLEIQQPANNMLQFTVQNQDGETETLVMNLRTQ